MEITLPNWFRRKSALSPIIGTSLNLSQKLILEINVLVHIDKFRQHSASATEAGGQLFGLVDNETIRIISATGPYILDERGRYHYRSHDQSAQKSIKKQAKTGLLYLGEWHTHAEDYPAPSNDDRDAMSKLLAHSKLNVDGLLMLIVGRKAAIEGYYCTFFNAGNIYQWNLSNDT